MKKSLLVHASKVTLLQPKWLLVAGTFLFFQLTFLVSFSQSKTRVTGVANWNTASTWIQVRTGTVAFVNGSATVTGTGTLFTTELQVGDVLMMDASPATIRGTVASIQSNTSLTLTANATANISTAAYGRQRVPGSTDDVFIGNTAIGTAVNLSLDINTTIKSLTFTALSGIANTLDNGTNSLNVTQDVTVNQPTGGGATVAWNINAGSATVSGNVSIVGTTANTSRIGKIAITTGALNITGNLIYNPITGSTDVQSVVDLSGGVANLNIAGTIQLLTGTGTLSPGTQSNVTLSSMTSTIPGGASIAYNNLIIPQTSGTLTAAGNLAINGTLTTNATILDMATFALTTGINAPNISTIKTQNISATPVPSGLNWGGIFMYNSTSPQTIVTGNYTNLDGSGGARTLGTTIGISGTFTTGAGVYTVASSTVDYNGAGNQTITPLTYNILNIGSSGTKTISSGTVTAALSTTLASVLTLSGGTLSIAATPIVNGTFNQTGGTFLSAYTTTIAGTFNQSGGTFHLASSIGINPSDHLVLTGTINQSGGTIFIKDWAAGGGTFNQTGSTALFKVFNDWKPGAGSIFNSTAGTVQFTGNGNSNFAAGTRQFTNIIVDAVSNPGFSNTVGSTLNISGDFTNNNSALANTINSTFNFNGAGNQTITSNSSLIYLGHVTINKSGGTLNLASNVGVAGDWTNNGGTVSGGSNTVTFSGATAIGGTASTTFPGIALADLAVVTMNNNNSCTSLTIPVSSGITTFTHAGNTALTVTGNVTINQPTAAVTSGWNINAGSATVSGNINIGGNVATVTRIAKITVTTGTLTVGGDVIYNSSATTAPTAVIDLSGGAASLNLAGNITLTNGTGTLTPGTASTTTFNGSGAQTITTASAITYNNIIVNKSSGSTTLGGAATVTNVTLTQGLLSLSTNTLTVTGSFTNNGGGLTAGSGTIIFAGTSSQTIGGSIATSFHNLTVNNAAGLTLSNNQTVNGTLTFTTGKISTGSYVLTCGSTSTITGQGSTTGYVIGNMANVLAVGATSKNFPLGTTSAYTPIDLVFSGVTTGGTITSLTTSTDHPNIGTSNLNASATANRYWTLSNSGVVFSNYSATFTFVSADLDGGVTTSVFEVRQYTGGSWLSPAVGTRTGTSTQATGITSFGDFQIGQYNGVPTLTSLNPTSGIPGQTLDIVLTGTGFVSGYSSVNVGPDMTINTTTFNSSTSITINVTIGAGATLGTRNISVTNSPPGGGTSGVQIFTINTITSWKGTTSTAWNVASNWTSGVPTASIDAVIGNSSFTGSFQPLVTAAAVCKSLTVGGTVVSTLTISTFPITVSGDISIITNGTLSHTSSGTIQLTGNWSNTGTFTAAGNSSPVVFAGTSIITGTTSFGTITVNGASTVTQNSGAATTSIGIITINSGGTYTLNGGTVATAGLTISGTLAVTAGTITSNNNLTINSGATLNQSGGLIHLASSIGINPSNHLVLTGTINQSGGTIFIKDWAAGGGTFNQTGSTALFKVFNDWKPGAGSIFNSTAGTVQFTGNGNSNFAAGTRQFTNIIVDAVSNPGFSNTVGSTLNISGDFTNNNSALANTINSTFNFNGAGNQTITSNSSLIYLGHVTINKSGGTLNLASNVGVAGDWTNNGGTVSGGSNTVTFSGATAIGGTASTTFPGIALADLAVVTMNNNNSCTSLTIPVSSGITTFTHAGNTALTVTGNVTINQPTAAVTSGWNINAGSATVSGNINIGGNVATVTRIAKITVTTGTLTVGGDVIYNSSATTAPTAVIDLSGGAASLNLAGNITLTNGTGTLTPGTASTTTFNGSGAQTITTASAITYNNIIVNKSSGSTTLGGAATVTNVTLTQGLLSLSTNTLTVTGSFTNNGGGLTAGSGTIIFAGTSSQTIGGSIATSFHNLTVNNAAGLTLSNNQTVNGTLTFTTGKISTGSYVLTCGSTSTITGQGSTTGYVIGNMANVLAVGATSKNFPLGTTSAYTPIDLVFSGVTTGGTITSLTTSTDHPNIGTSNLNASATANRYWTLSNSGVVFSNYSATFTFVSADLDGGVTTSVFEVRQYTGGSWLSPAVGTRTGTSTQATGITSFGDFQIGQYNGVPTLTSLNPTSGIPGQTLDIVLTGTGFVSGYSSVNVGPDMTINTTTFNSSTSITINVTIGAGATLGTRNISVTNSPPGGGTSGVQIFTINTITSWKGTTSTAWNVASNWTSGVPTESIDAIIGNSSFTGSFQPLVTAAAVCKSLTVGGTVVSTLTISTFPITVSGDISIITNGTLSHTSSGTIQLTGNWSNTGTFTAAGNSSPVVFAGTSIITGTTSFGTITVNGASTVTQNSGAATTSIGIITINSGGTYTLNGGTVATDALTASGLLAVNGGTITTNSDFIINSGATLNQSGGLIHLASSIGSNPNKNLILTGTINQSGGTIFIKDWAAGGGTFNQTGSTALFKVFNDWKPGAGSIFNSTAGTVQFTGNGNSNFAAGTRQFTNIIVDAASNPGFSNTVGSTLNISGDFTNNNSALATNTNCSFTFNGTGTQNLISNSTGATFGHVTINKTSGSLVLLSDIGVSGNWDNVNNTAFTGSTYTVKFTGTGNISGTTTFSGLAITSTAISYNLNNNNSCNSLLFETTSTVTSLTHSGTVNLTVNGDVTINQNLGRVTTAWNINAGTATVTGNILLGGNSTTTLNVAKINVTTGTLTVNGNVTFNSAVSVAANALIDLTGGAATVNFKGSVILANGSGTISPGTSSNVYYNGTGAQTIGGGSSISYYNFILNKASGTATLGGDMNVTHVILTQGTMTTGASNFNINVSGNWTNNGVAFTGGTSTVKFLGLNGTIGGTTSTAFPTIAIDGLSTTDYVMNNNNTCATLSFNTGGFSSSFTHSGSAILTVNGNVSISQPTATATNAWNINAGSASISGSLDFAGTNNTATRVGKITITTGTLNANGGISFAANTAPASKVIDMSGGAGTLNLKGALTFGNLGGTLTAGTAGSIFNYADDAAAQTIRFFPGGAYHNLHINTTGSTGAVLAAAITTTNVTGNLRVQSGTLSNGSFAIALNTSKTFEVVNAATFKMTGTTGMVTGTTLTKTFGATSTCDYNGTAQTVGAETYGHLILSTSGIKTMPATAMTIAGNFTTSGTASATAANALTISGNVTLGSGTTFNAASYTHNIAGNWTNNGATFTPATSTLNLNGTGTQTLGGSISTLGYNNLIINKASGGVTLAIDLTVSGSLTFTSGSITTSTYKVIIPSGGSISGAGQSTGYVKGNLQKYFSSIAGGTFEIGGNLYYSPASISFATVTTAGSLIAGVTTANHPNVSTSDIADRNITRYWTLSTPGSGALAYTNATITFNWNTADNFSPLTTTLLVVAQYSASTWTYPTVTGTTTSTSIQINGISTLGAFAVGQRPCINLTWTGAVNNQWDNGGNWSCGETPTSSRNVNIPSSLSTYPVISGGIIALVNNITIQSGGALTVSSSTLKIAGTISNSGTLTATAGTIEFNGTSAQTIPAITFATNTIKDLTINNTAGVTLSGTVNITGNVTISAGSLTTGGYLVLKSSSTATARIATITSVAGTPINGNVTVERYIQGRRKYRLITSPVTTHANSILTSGQEAFSIWGNWQNQGNNSTANTGTIITGGSSANGFDQQTTTASFYTYNESGRSYTGFTTANGKNTKYTPLKAGVAYYMFVYGDRLNAVNTSSPNHTVLSASGTILSGDQTYTTSSTIPLTNTVGNYTMLGNPFASPIDWATVTKTNLYNTFWGWDPNLSSTGGYVTVSTTGTVTLISPFTGSTGLNQYIQSGQGFFVRTSATSPVLTIKESDKVSNYNANAFRTSVNDIPLIAVNLFDNSTKIFIDGAVAAFSNSFSNHVGKEDAQKMSGSAEVVSIVNGSDLLSIEARQMPGMDDTISLKMSKLTKPQYLLQIFTNQMDNSNVQPYLHDSYLNSITKLSVTDTNRIVFNVTSDASSFNTNRFKIIYSNKNGDPVIVNTPPSELRIFPNPVTNQKINYELSELEQGVYAVIVSNSKGEKLLSRTLSHAGGKLQQAVSIDKILPPGLYYFRIESKKLRYSKIIFIQ